MQADAKGYMCAYTSVNGLPSCGSDFLSGMARNEWNFSGYVARDSAVRVYYFPVLQSFLPGELMYNTSAPVSIDSH